jgi:hypothetical protein
MSVGGDLYRGKDNCKTEINVLNLKIFLKFFTGLEIAMKFCVFDTLLDKTKIFLKSYFHFLPRLKLNKPEKINKWKLPFKVCRTVDLKLATLTGVALSIFSKISFNPDFSSNTNT